uniref:PIF1/LRR1 pleckstrin homology domain-containing protein n=1 Tax=Chelydra serpentina TaxID=8475 RepID=A0A8C3T9T3_CHESE
MRLQCEVEVRSRLLPTCGLRGRAKGARALLSLGRQPGRAEQPVQAGETACLQNKQMETNHSIPLAFGILAILGVHNNGV